ncbi:hypothetical protein A4S06_04695 [Erysipelotrichaceae bacterium MTC7]|nr:hypothetical protein A4S06_04695 [Erysipelotrichaceae bacterium MTC7]
MKALLKNPDGQFLCLHKTKDEAIGDASDSLYDLPGGRKEAKETMMQGLFREVVEETGIHIQTEQVQCVLDETEVTRKDQSKLYVFTYLVHIGKEKVQLSEEHDAYVWVTKDSQMINKLPIYIQNLIQLTYKKDGE